MIQIRFDAKGDTEKVVHSFSWNLDVTGPLNINVRMGTQSTFPEKAPC